MVTESKRFKSQRQRTVLVLTTIAQAKVSTFFHWFPEPQFPLGNVSMGSELCYRRGTLYLGNFNLLLWAMAYLPFGSRGRQYLFTILDSMHACPFLQWKTLPLSSKAVPYITSLKKET
jgi:hypothetical protein